MTGPWLLLWLMRPPCMPFELGAPGARAGEPAAPVAEATPASPAPKIEAPPPPPMPVALAGSETARYQIGYGPFDVGEISLSLGAADGHLVGRTPLLLHAEGHGEGAILGLGRLETRVETDFDAGDLSSRRWTSARRTNDRTTRDTIEQPESGKLGLTRLVDGGGARRATFVVPGPALDPVGFLLRVRAAPPSVGGGPQVLYVMDGQALWRMTLTNEGPELINRDTVSRPALRLAGRADPIRHDGAPDAGDRPSRTFVLWLSGDPTRVPLRLEVPVGISNVVVSLVELQRTGPRLSGPLAPRLRATPQDPPRPSPPGTLGL